MSITKLVHDVSMIEDVRILCEFNVRAAGVISLSSAYKNGAKISGTRSRGKSLHN
jgi:hypothetical protein